MTAITVSPLRATRRRPVPWTRLAELGIPLNKKVGHLSGGQKAQLALTVALARRPDLLVLDEPLASLDPLARHDFIQSVMETVAAEGVSVVLSSHVVAELERMANYLIVLSFGQVQVAGEVDDLVAEYGASLEKIVLAAMRESGREVAA